MDRRLRGVADRAWRLMERIPPSAVLLISVAGFVGTLAALVLVIPLSGKVASQATAGARARETQCDREPVIRKVSVAAYAVRDALPKRSRITREELDLFLAQAPKGCPSTK